MARKNTNGANLGFEEKLWAAVDKLISLRCGLSCLVTYSASRKPDVTSNEHQEALNHGL